MWNVAGLSGALTAAMLAVGGVALATEPAVMPPEKVEASGTIDAKQQSGKELSHDLSSVRGENARKLQEGLKEQGFYDGKIDGILGPITKEALSKFQESKGFAASGKLDMQTASALGIELSDVQPVSGQEPIDAKPLEEEQPIDEKLPVDEKLPEGTSADPVATPMIDSGSTTTEPQSGSDGMSGSDTSTDLQSGEATDNATGTGSMDTGAHDGMKPGEHPASHNQPQPMGGVEGQDDPNVVNDSDIETQSGTNTTFDKKTIKQVEKALKAKNLFTGKVDGVLDAETTSAIRRFQTDNGIIVTGQLDARTLDALGVKSHQSGSSPGTMPHDPKDMMTPNEGTTPAPISTPSDPVDPPTPNGPMDPGGSTPR